MAVCHGNGPDHCCYIAGRVCPYLEENPVEGRRWACGLLRELGSWPKVYRSTRYRRTDAAKWFRVSFPSYGCGDWPQRIGALEGLTSAGCCFTGEGG